MEHLDDEENITIIRNGLNKDELALADQVANEILNEDKENQKRILILVFIFVLLTLFVSFVGFSIFKINRGTDNNIINAGSILFSYNESSNYINMINTFPMSDDLGKNLSGEGEYFEFNISSRLNSKKINELTYEISLTPSVSSLDTKYVRVYLEENGKGVSLTSNIVNYYNDLPESTIRKGSKLLYKKTINSKSDNRYVFRMWVSPEYNVDSISRTFSCYVNVNAY